MNNLTHSQRIEIAKKSLLGVSIGDAFGDSFFGEEEIITKHINLKQIPETKWEFTDDTVMSIAVFEELEALGEINQDSLVQRFCKNHDLDPNRGYGATLRKLLREVKEGGNWQELSKAVFDGQGSMGNGAAMRVCPIGAYFFDELPKVKEQAAKSAEVTHANQEAIAGAIAVAVATALAAQAGIQGDMLPPEIFIQSVLHELPDSDTKSKINKTLHVPVHYQIETVTEILGNGKHMLAQDTVPFVIWCAAHNLQNFEAALWKAVSALGDRDTICAMVGGITILSSSEAHLPLQWVKCVELIDESVFRKR